MDQAASLPAPRPQQVVSLAEALRPSCRALAACWAVIGTVGSGYLFLSSTLPVTTLGEPPLWGPGWLSSIAVMAAIVLGLPWLGLPLILLPVGLVHLRRGAPGRLHWQIGWATLTAAEVLIEAMLVSGFAVPLLGEDYQGQAVVGWIWLTESAACLAIGMATLTLLARAARASDRRRQPS
jgi:hypothetical protein